MPRSKGSSRPADSWPPDRRVGDQHETMPVGERSQGRHRSERARQVDGQDRDRAWADRGLRRGHIDQAPFIDIHHDGRETGPHDRLPGGEIREPGQDHLATRSPEERQHRDEPVGAVGHGDDIPPTDPLGSFTLQSSDERALAQPP